MSRALVRMLRQGCPWRDLDCEGLPWRTVYGYFCLLREAQLLSEVLHYMATFSTTGIKALDATYVRVHQDGANPVGGQAAALMGRSRGGLTSKLHLLCDSQGYPLRLHLGSGAQADVSAAPALVSDLQGGTLVADRGYDADDLRGQLYAAGVFPCIPVRSTRTEARAFHRGYYQKRHTVENAFGQLKRWRRIATRFDKLAASYLTWAHLGALAIWFT